MIKSFEKSSELDNSLIKQVFINGSLVNEEQIFQMLNQNIATFAAMSISPTGHMQKLAIMSAIMRANHVNSIKFEKIFDATHAEENSETFTCNLIVEAHANDNIVYKPLMMNKFNSLQEKIIQQENDEAMDLGINQPIRINSILNQTENIRDLFYSISKQFNFNYEAGLAITSLLLFEMEKLSSLHSPDTIIFHDMFDTANFLDKWFCCLYVHVDFNKSNLIQTSNLVH